MSPTARDTVEDARLAAAIRWTGAGAATAFATLLLMVGGFGFASAVPASNNIDETVIGLAFGALGAAAWLATVIVAGSDLARSALRHRGWLRILPALASIAWFLLVVAAAFGRWFPGTASATGLAVPEAIWSLIVWSIYSLGAVPIGLGLLIANVVLRVQRWRKKSGRPFGYAAR